MKGKTEMTMLDRIDEINLKLSGLQAIIDFLEGAENREALGIPVDSGILSCHGVLMRTTVEEVQRLINNLPRRPVQPECGRLDAQPALKGLSTQVH